LAKAKRRSAQRASQKQHQKHQHKGKRQAPTDALLKEADMQTRAIMRLETYKRLMYSGIAIGALLIGYGFFAGGGTTMGVIGIVLAVICTPLAIVLYIGIRNGKRNVDKILDAYKAEHGVLPQEKAEG